MATRFELVLQGPDIIGLRAAGEEAIREIERLEGQLSIYRPGSELSQVNARAGQEAVRVEPRLFHLLERARDLSAETGGAFDITVAPLMRCWGLLQREGRIPSGQERAAARDCTGWQHLQLDARHFTVYFSRPGMMLDLGSIGKGYALEQAAELLREAGVASALLHGGTSTVCAIGRPYNAEAWSIALADPEAEAGRFIATTSERQRARFAPLATVDLCDESLSVSAVWGKSFTVGDRTFGHVLDPAAGEPVAGALMAACALPSATDTDAISTALLVRGLDDWERLSTLRAGMRSLVVGRSTDGGLPEMRFLGIEPGERS